MTTINWEALVPKEENRYMFSNHEDKYCKCSPAYGERKEIKARGKCMGCLARESWRVARKNRKGVK